MTVFPQRGGSSAAPTAGSILPSPASETTEPASSLYIHIPFCFHKCHYCDFYSIVDTQDRQKPFTARLIRELAALAPYTASKPLRTIFIGGGTPSLLRPDLWTDLLAALHQHFNLSNIKTTAAAPPAPPIGGIPPSSTVAPAEFTVECNPETVTPELMAIFKAGAVTRISMGAQSFNTHHLKTLERWHNPENIPRALELARAAGIHRQSLDLIFGIPGQTLADWQRDLETALAQNTEHLSCYSLTYEPNTAMTARLKRGEFTPMDEDIEVDMHRLAWQLTRAAGMDRYEVSNFSRPGAECQHNLAYWRQHSWLAAGPSASGHLRMRTDPALPAPFAIPGHRWKTLPRLDDYLTKGDTQGFAAITDHEPPDPARALREHIMTALRLREGLDATQLLLAAESLHPGSPARLTQAAKQAESRGHLIISTATSSKPLPEGGVGEGHSRSTTNGPNTNERWTLTDEGILFADGLAVELFTALD